MDVRQQNIGSRERKTSNTKIKMELQNKSDLSPRLNTVDKTVPVVSEKIKIEQEIRETGDDLESVLSKLKLTGRYHLKFFLLFGLLCFISSQHSTNYIFAAENVEYTCKYTSCNYAELSNIQQNSTLDYKCSKYELFYHNGTCTEDNFDTSSASDCTEWVYKNPNSFVAQFNLGCEDWKRTLVGTMHSTGFMLGLLFIAPLSDKIGRKRLIIFNMLAAGILGITKSIVTSYWIYIALEMFEPFFGEVYSTAFTLGVETVTKEDRPIIMVILSSFSAIGQIMTAILAYLIPNWRMYLMCLYAPPLVIITYSFLLDESLRWLLIKGKKTDAEEIIQKAAIMNNIKIDQDKIANVKCEANTTSASLGSCLKLTFSSRKLFLRLLICFCIWFTTLFNAYALLINSVSLEGNKYLNYGLVSLCGAVAGFILFYLLTKFRRKGPLILSFTLTGVFCGAQAFVSKDYRWLSTLLYLCGHISTTISVRVAYLYTSELFPTYTRNTMLALCSSLGRTGTLLAPQTPLLMKYWSGLPTLLVGVLSLLTATVVTLIPDTSEDVLPDDVKQAEALGSKQKEKEICSNRLPK